MIAEFRLYNSGACVAARNPVRRCNGCSGRGRTWANIVASDCRAPNRTATVPVQGVRVEGGYWGSSNHRPCRCHYVPGFYGCTGPRRIVQCKTAPLCTGMGGTSRQCRWGCRATVPRTAIGKGAVRTAPKRELELFLFRACPYRGTGQNSLQHVGF